MRRDINTSMALFLANTEDVENILIFKNVFINTRPDTSVYNNPRCAKFINPQERVAVELRDLSSSVLWPLAIPTPFFF